MQVADSRIPCPLGSYIGHLKARCKRRTECDNRRNEEVRDGKMSKKCSDKDNECKYESIGTLSYRASCKPSLFFVPDSDHVLEYSAGSYAVFVGRFLPGSCNDRKALAVKLRDSDNGITLKKSLPIDVPCEAKDLLQVAWLAAEKQTKITLTVTRNGESFNLQSIILPAR